MKHKVLLHAMSFDRKLLYFFVRDALRGYSEHFRITDHQNPIQINLNGKRYSICASYIHDSGGNRPNDDEIRIQLSRSTINQQYNLRRRARPAFIGFSLDGQNFISWDPNHVFSLQAGQRVSIYGDQRQLTEATTNHASVHKFRAHYLQQDSFAIALPTYALGFFLENIRQFHSLRSEDSVIDLMKHHRALLSGGVTGATDSIDLLEGTKRKKFNYTRTAYQRDPHFRELVLDAYRHSCCICGRQLGIIEAAHIIPHSHPQSPNTVTNGLALCVEHHRLYDDGLLLPGPNRKLVYNTDRASYLEQTNRAKGLQKIATLDGKSYHYPRKLEHRPKDQYLEKGLKLRMVG